jgi:cytochrome c-type biogenesis protein CcmH/NrfG
MISTLVDLLGTFYANQDLANVEVIARSLDSAIPGNLVSLQFLGLVYYRTARVTDAVRFFDRALRRRKLSPDAPPSEIQAGYEAGHEFEGSAAAVCYREATRHSPSLARAWYDIGTLLLELKRFELAIPALGNALKAQPSHPQAMQAIAAASRTDDLAVVEDGFLRLLAQQPDSAQAYCGLGRVHRKRRDFAAARACFARARKLRGRQPRPSIQIA